MTGRFIEDKRVRPGIGRRGLLKFFGAAAIVAPAAAIATKAEAKPQTTNTFPTAGNFNLGPNDHYLYCTMMVGEPGESTPFKWSDSAWDDEPDDDY